MKASTGKPANILLVGFMATGKSCAGKIVAEQLGWPFVDADEEIQRRAGKSIPDIFRDDGEPAFRKLETSVIRDLCSGSGRVVAAGGGAFVSEENQKSMLAGGLVVCLTALPETVLERLEPGMAESGANEAGTAQLARPMLAGEDTLGRITQLLAQRTSAYGQAHKAVATDDLTPAQVAQRILEIFTTIPRPPEERK